MKERKTRMSPLSPKDSSILVTIADQRGKFADVLRKQLLPELESPHARIVAELLIDRATPSVIERQPKNVRTLFKVYDGWAKSHSKRPAPPTHVLP